MGKSNHFSGQPLYSQVINLLNKSKILRFSRENGGEHYTKRFNCRIHLVVMLYAVIMRFDSLGEITASLLAETHKLAHLGITFKIGRSTLANAIKIQIWVTLIANLLLMLMQKGLKRQWTFSGPATMVRITLMYYVDFYSLFNNPEKDWEIILGKASDAPPEPSLFD